MFSCEFCGIFKIISFTEHLQKSVSVILQSIFYKEDSFNVIAESCQVNWKPGRIKACGLIFVVAKISS